MASDIEKGIIKLVLVMLMVSLLSNMKQFT